MHSARTAQAQRAQHRHNAHMKEEIGGFCYNWQYSCLYKPYYTPKTLDSLMFARRSTRILQHNLGRQCLSVAKTGRTGSSMDACVTSSPQACGTPHNHRPATKTQEESPQHG